MPPPHTLIFGNYRYEDGAYRYYSGRTIIAPHDYQTGCIITSFSKRRKTESTLSFVMNFYESFVKQTEEKYPQIKKASVWNAIYSGIIEAEGVDNGISLINKFRKELSNSQTEYKEDIINRIDSFMHNIKNHGYLPKQLYFAVKRFHRWYSLKQKCFPFSTGRNDL